MFIVWKGWGLAVFLVIIPFVLLGDLLVGAVTGDSTYTHVHSWTIALKAIPAGIAVWFLGKYLANRKSRTVIDVETGESLVLKEEHSLFFIKMHWWGVFFVAVGIGHIINAIVG